MDIVEDILHHNFTSKVRFIAQHSILGDASSVVTLRISDLHFWQVMAELLLLGESKYDKLAFGNPILSLGSDVLAPRNTEDVTIRNKVYRAYITYLSKLPYDFKVHGSEYEYGLIDVFRAGMRN